MKAKKMLGGGHVMTAQSARPAKGSGPKHVRRVSIERAANGGHTVSHDYQQGGDGMYHEPTTHAFGPKDHGKLMKHLKTHIGVGMDDNDGDE